MKRNFKISLVLLFLIFSFLPVFSQKTMEIPKTSFQMEIPEGYLVDGDGTISNQRMEMQFMEMHNANYFEQKSDFDNIEEKSKKKGLILKEKKFVKINNYEGIRITYESVPTIMYFFGDEEFCSILYVYLSVIPEEKDFMELEKILSSIVYTKSPQNAMKVNANFEIVGYEENWEFKPMTSTSYAFRNKSTEDVILLLQFPAVTSMTYTEKQLAEEFYSKLKSKIKENPQEELLETPEHGDFEIQGKSGYRITVKKVSPEEKNFEIVYYFVFKNEKGMYVFNGMGVKDNKETLQLFEDFIKSIKMK